MDEKFNIVIEKFRELTKKKFLRNAVYKQYSGK